MTLSGVPPVRRVRLSYQGRTKRSDLAKAIHGLRRTFSPLGEAAGAPAGAIAQVTGHKPSAIAEGYRPRSIDALRPYLARIERFILDKAGVTFNPAKAAPGGLRVVAARGGSKLNRL